MRIVYLDKDMKQIKIYFSIKKEITYNEIEQIKEYDPEIIFPLPQNSKMFREIIRFGKMLGELRTIEYSNGKSYFLIFKTDKKGVEEIKYHRFVLFITLVLSYSIFEEPDYDKIREQCRYYNALMACKRVNHIISEYRDKGINFLIEYGRDLRNILNIP